MAIEKPRNNRRRARRTGGGSGGGGGGGGGNGGGRRRDHHMRSEAEQLDYEMELMRARREGREDEFVREEREKMRARAAARLDDEMDAYFAAKKSSDNTEPTNGAADGPDKPADVADDVIADDVNAKEAPPADKDMDREPASEAPEPPAPVKKETTAAAN